MKITVLKLSNGDEIIGNRFGDGDTFKMEKVRSIVMMQTHSGEPAGGLMPWAISNPDGDVEIDAAHVVAVIEPIDDIKRAYQNQTGKIQLLG